MNHIRGALRRRGGRNASPMPDPTLSLGERGRSPGWLSRMHRSNSSSKRSASPASPVSVSNPSSRPPTRSSNMEGASSGKPVVPEPEPALESPTMPLFLRLTRAEMLAKFAELVRLESERIGEKHKDPNGQWARLEPNLALDRYSNIHPWEKNRIRLKVPEEYNDYINASPVTVVSDPKAQDENEASIEIKHRYICMQGPKRETVDHVWHMIWHELSNPSLLSPAVIIMLSPTYDMDPNRPGLMCEKCFPYFPYDENSPPLIINDTSTLGEDFKGTVRFISKEPPVPGTELEIRKFVMTVEGKDEEKPIWHFLYPSWPDFGALEEHNLESLLSLMSLSREKNADSENPRVIHCSAGVGRTGTFVSLEFLLEELQRGAWEGWDDSEKDPVFDTVNQLRKQRRTMVQSVEQYIFIYEVLKKTWEEKYGASCVGGEHRHSGTIEETSASLWS